MIKIHSNLSVTYSVQLTHLNSNGGKLPSWYGVYRAFVRSESFPLHLLIMGLAERVGRDYHSRWDLGFPGRRYRNLGS